MNNKIIVIGLDGTTFKLLDPLIKAGKMPNLKKIQDQGVRSTLLSTKPPVTAPAWTTFATGVNPGKHGCYDFFLPGNTIEDFHPTNSDEIKVPTFYELMEQQDKKAILINLPNSFPAKTNHPTITSLMTVGDEFVFPKSLKEKYPELADYPLTPDETIRLKTVKAMFLKEDWDLFFFLFSSTDWISHLVFNEMETGENPEAMKVFDLVDEYFGWLLKNLPENSNLYVMSDHGFATYTEVFYINRWLEEQGYLVTTTGSGKLEENATARRKELAKAREGKQVKIKINKRLFKTLLFHPSLEKAAKKFYKKVVKKVLPLHIDVNIGIDMNKTKLCFPRGSMLQTLYLNYDKNFTKGIISDETEYKTIIQDVKNKLENLTTPHGTPVTEQVYTKEELYGPNASVPSPDLHCKTRDVWIVGHLHSKSIFEEAISNKHDEFGIFYAFGKDIKAGQKLDNAEIADICPTLLHHMNMSIPDYTDGKVLDIFKKDTEVAQRKPKIETIHFAEKKNLNSVISEIDI